MDEAYVRIYPELERHHFWWRSRRETVLHAIDDIAGDAALSILDIGCGSGLMLSDLADRHQVRGIEIDPLAVPSDAEMAPLITIGDARIVDVGIGRYDVVLLLDVVEHVEDPIPLLDVARRALTPGGSLICTAPAFGWLWTAHDELNGHYQRYTRQSLRDVLRAGGFEVIRCEYLFAALVAPRLLVKLMARLRLPIAEIPRVPTNWINAAALRWFRLENRVGRALPYGLPVGTSVLAIAREAT